MCYEISEDGQNQIRKNAQLNNVDENIEIRGEAKRNFYDDFSQEELSSSLILMDIEGGEFHALLGSRSLLKNGAIDIIQFEYGHAARAARVSLFDIIQLLEK